MPGSINLICFKVCIDQEIVYVEPERQFRVYENVLLMQTEFSSQHPPQVAQNCYRLSCLKLQLQGILFTSVGTALTCTNPCLNRHNYVYMYVYTYMKV